MNRRDPADVMSTTAARATGQRAPPVDVAGGTVTTAARPFARP